MFESIYQFLGNLGYHHPLHPTLTHAPIGLTIGAFVFGIIGLISGEGYLRTARRCAVLALIAAPPTILLGVMDWQHYYKGAFLFPIVAKLILALLLLLFLTLGIVKGVKGGPTARSPVLFYTFCLGLVILLGYFGGEMVYGKKAAPGRAEATGEAAGGTGEPAEGAAGETAGDAAAKGAEIFEANCAACHHTDTTETKIGPGLAGLFDGGPLPVSGRPVSAGTVREQIRSPYENMPAFPDMPEAEVDDLIAYLKGL